MGVAIRKAIKLPYIFMNLLLDLRQQKKFMKLHIAPLLKKSIITNDGTLTEKDFLKINRYYGLAVPAILGEAFCTLRGTKMTESERWVSTSQGVITGLFDDFFDELELPEDQIVNMVNHPENIHSGSSNELLFLDFYKLSLQKAAFPNLIKEQLMMVHKAQVASIEQENPKINASRIWEITCIKGGDSVLFYRTAFNNLLVKGEKEALFQLGSLMQFENDIFDIYKDFKSGISTLPTTILLVKDLRKLYKKQIRIFIELCHKMDYPSKQVEQFLDRVMPVINRGYVCLDKYQKLEDNNANVFDISSFSRKQLICDMEKPLNFLRTIQYQLRSNYSTN